MSSRIKYAAACLSQGMSYASAARAAGINELDLRATLPRRSAVQPDAAPIPANAFEECAAILPDATPLDCRKIAGLALALLCEKVGPVLTQTAMVNIASALPAVRTRVAAQPVEAVAVPARIPAREVLDFVADKYGLTFDDLCAARRTRDWARPRQMAMYAVHHLCPHMSLPAIGRMLGGRDHTTILHGIRKITSLIIADAAIAGAAHAILQHFTDREDFTGGSPFADALRFSRLCSQYGQAMKAAA